MLCTAGNEWFSTAYMYQRSSKLAGLSQTLEGKIKIKDGKKLRVI